MTSDAVVGAFEGLGAAPASMEVALAGGPWLDALSFGGLTVALVAAAVLLLLNREATA